MMPRFRFDNPWRVLWQIASSDRLLGAVLLVLALVLVLTAWLPQTSADASSSDVAWQAEVQRRFGGNAQFEALRAPLQSIGAFNVGDAVGFRLLLALLALSLLTHLVESLELVWRKWRGDNSPQGEAHDPATAESEEAQRPADPTEIVRRPSSWPWCELGSLVVYLGGLTVLTGAAITSLLSWQTGQFPLAAGENVPLGHGSELVLNLESLNQDGRQGVGKIWHRGDSLAEFGTLAVGRPLKARGVGAYLVGGGAGLRVQATGRDAQPLDLVAETDSVAQEDLILTFTRDEERHLVGVPEAELVLLLTMSELGKVDARPRVQVFESGSGERILERDALEDTTLTLGDVSITLTPIMYATILAIHDPGAFWIQLGVFALISGAGVRGAYPLRRAWQRRQPGTAGELADTGLMGNAKSVSQSETPSLGSKSDLPTGGGV